ncbi:Wzz/FepE/Etk N-terminal domain-containing protein [Sphingosinicella sp.]|uniref:Wzz/FepE/Etk N-terminal domain-containing protein n=1 Tax=Sphingosinicella sp. TaxID=1917971 RepID=UPI0035B29483
MNDSNAVIAREPNDVDTLDLKELFDSLWAGRWVLLACVVAAFVVALIYLNATTYKYTARMKVTPVSSTSSVGSSLGGLSGLASIAGVNLSQGQGASPFQLYTEGLDSQVVAEALAQRRDLMQVIFKSEWDDRTQRFVEPGRGPVGETVRGVRAVLGLPVYTWRPPGSAHLQLYLSERVKLTQNAKTSIATITYEHEDPRFAVKFLSAIHEELDESLRQKALARANLYIDYLSRQLQHVTLIEHREALAQALAEQEKMRMMASSRLAFAAEPFGPATPSLYPTSPKPIPVLVFAVMFGAAIGVGVVIVLRQFRGRRIMSE